MVVAQLGRLPFQRRAQLNGIAIAEMNGLDAAIPVEQAVGRVEVLQAEIAIAQACPLEDGMNAAEARLRQGQLTAGIPADADAIAVEEQLLALLSSGPEFDAGLMGRERRQGGADGSRALADGPAQKGPPQGDPGLALRRWEQGVERRGGCQTCAAARP